MGNLSGLNWPKPWYQDLWEFMISPYVLPFTLTLIVLALMLVTSFLVTRPSSR